MVSTGSCDISILAGLAMDFRQHLDKLKGKIAPTAFQWYPYDSLSNLHTLDRLLTNRCRYLLKLAGDRPILDIGCADGDLALFLASLGYRVSAVDNPVTNFNSMRALRALNDELGRKVDIVTLDLDSRFQLPDSKYGLVFLLGVLYHLRNPFYMLDLLSKHGEYAVISTTITSYVPGLYDRVSGASVAYLADVYEINRDSTNYWLFSDGGFRRLLQRSGWEICDYLLTGDPDLTGAVGEQRAFTLLQSRFVRKETHLLLGQGWHEPEEGGWRWTNRNFSVRFEGVLADKKRELSLSLFLPPDLIRALGVITISACANGIDLPPGSFSDPGSHLYCRDMDGVPVFGGDIRIDFSLSGSLSPDPIDPRERGIVVVDLQIVSPEGAKQSPGR